MKRERMVVLLLCVVVGLVATLLGVSIVSDHERSAVVSRLKAKAAGIPGDRMGMPPLARASAAQGAGLQEASSAGDEDRVAGFTAIFARRDALSKESGWDEIKDVYGKDPSEWTEAERGRVAAFLGAHRDFIEESRRLAGLGGPAAKLDFSQKMKMSVSYLYELRDCARFLIADAAVHGAGGNAGEAVQDLLAVIGLGRTLDQEPILVSQLTRFAIDGMALGAIEQALRGGDLSAEVCSQLMEEAQRASSRDLLADAIIGDAMVGLSAFEGIRDGDTDVFGANEFMNTASGLGAVGMRLYGSALARPWLNADEERYADIMERVGDASRLPYYEARSLLEGIDQDIADLPRTRVMSRMLLPFLGRVAQSQAVHEARFSMMSIGLAAEQYRAQHGAYPETLEAVSGRFAGGLPLDPFTGNAFEYEVGEEGFTLTSMSGGSAFRTTPEHRRPYEDAGGNVVWRGGR